MLMRWELNLFIDLSETVLTTILIGVNAWLLKSTALLLVLLAVEFLDLVLVGKGAYIEETLAVCFHSVPHELHLGVFVVTLDHLFHLTLALVLFVPVLHHL